MSSGGAAGTRPPHVDFMNKLASIVVVTLGFLGSLSAQDLHFADLGDCVLENESVIKNCQVGYRTFGALNADRSNAVLFPTWFSGRTEALAEYIGPRGMIDSSEHFVISVGAFGNGVSSSPSTSRTQQGDAFPEFTVGDMVTAQYRLLTEALHVRRLRAVVGISMGGMQAFQWVTAYPRFADRVVAIAGSPRLGAYDSLLWQAELNAIERALAAHSDSRRARAMAMSAAAELHELALRTPAAFNAANKPENVDALISQRSADLVLGMDPLDWASQVRAMLSHDVYRAFGGSLQPVAQLATGKLLVVVSKQDHMVTPGPALAFAEAANAETLVIEGDCGHLIFECDNGKVTAKVREFLAPDPTSAQPPSPQPAGNRVVDPSK